MSFIYSRKLKNKIYVLADSKLTVSPNDESRFVKNVGKYNYDNIKSLGIVKNVIINKNICIASAGILEDFNELLKIIDDNRIIDVEKICNYALKIHLDKNMETDFIVALSDCLNSKLYEIKNGVLLEVESAWIGSHDCFNEFQKVKHNEKIAKKLPKLTGLDMQDGYADQIADSFFFKEVVNSNIDDMVGGNIIGCFGVNGFFKYNESLETHVEKEQFVSSNDNVRLFDSSFDGGYAFHVYQSCDYYKMYIYQLEKGIVFKPFVTDEKYNHLRLPKIYDMSENDFLTENCIENISIAIC